MMRWCRICGLALLFLFLTSHPIHAYERDVHYDLTKYLAGWAGFSEGEAEQVAAADQEIDAKPEFNPLPNPNFCPELRKIAGPASAIVAIPVACKNDPEFQRMLTAQRAYHFVDSERLRALRESAFQGRNLKTLGHYLHALQDTFAHSLMDYADLPPLDKLLANLGRLPDEKVIGHFLYGHSLDKTYERPDLAEQMARYVYAELVLFKGSVNRWNDIDAAVVRFVREQDSRKKLAHLSESTLQGPAPTTSQSPSLRPDKPQEPTHQGRTFAEWQADLRDPSPKVRERAALALRNFGSTVVPILTQTLRDSDANVRRAAANTLGDIGPAAKDAAPALVQALEDPVALVRWQAESTRWRIDPSVLEHWKQATSQPPSLRPDKPHEPMHEGRTFVEWQADLRDPSPAVREKAALALGHFGSKAVPILTQTLRDSDANVRWATADALGRIGPAAKDAVAALAQARKDPIRIVEQRAVIALREIDPAALKELERAEREEAQLRWEAAQRQAQQQSAAAQPPGQGQRKVPCKEEFLRHFDAGGWAAMYAMQLGTLRPCPKEGDEEKKAAADRLNVAFTRKHGIRESVACEALSRNPFAYEGKVVALNVTFQQMIARDRGLFGCGVAVSGIPQGVFSSREVEVVLAGRVLGNTEAKIGPVTLQVPHLQYVGVHICTEKACADFFGPASLRGE